MLICGLKAGHDGAVAVIEYADDRARLITSIEAEKVGCRDRYSDLGDPELIQEILAQIGLVPGQIDRWVIDGWHGPMPTPWFNSEVSIGGEPYPVAPYTQSEGSTPALSPYVGRLTLRGHEYAYESYRHAEGHLASAYATSPACVGGRPTGVVVWDGGMFPQVYTVRPDGIDYHGNLFQVRSRVYQEFGVHLEPFSKPESSFDYLMSVSGKLMAYAGLGKPNRFLTSFIQSVWHELDVEDPGNDLWAKVKELVSGLDTGSVLASFQQAIGLELVAGLRRFRGVLPEDLCLVGGAALNIKWNSMVRSSGLFNSVWVPPFPNDAGSALGTAYASLMARGFRGPLEWDVYSGPEVQPGEPVEGWTPKPCSVAGLAEVLATGKPVTVVSGRAELGPRALGHRSILASPCSPEMKVFLNEAKGREDYRPVAPMCLEEHAPEIFNPGVPDPYMLFDHAVRKDWVDKIPAVLHLDGTARLQTVSSGLPYEIVSAFHAITGVPVLCNTSANFSGKGFFATVEDAMRWGKTPYVWSDGTLYARG